MKLYKIEHKDAYIPEATTQVSLVKAVNRWNAIFKLVGQHSPVFQVIKKVRRVGPFVSM